MHIWGTAQLVNLWHLSQIPLNRKSGIEIRKQAARLLLSFSPFPVLNPTAPFCIVWTVELSSRVGPFKLPEVNLGQFQIPSCCHACPSFSFTYYVAAYVASMQWFQKVQTRVEHTCPNLIYGHIMMPSDWKILPGPTRMGIIFIF